MGKNITKALNHLVETVREIEPLIPQIQAMETASEKLEKVQALFNRQELTVDQTQTETTELNTSTSGTRKRTHRRKKVDLNREPQTTETGQEQSDS